MPVVKALVAYGIPVDVLTADGEHGSNAGTHSFRHGELCPTSLKQLADEVAARHFPALKAAMEARAAAAHPGALQGYTGTKKQTEMMRELAARLFASLQPWRVQVFTGVGAVRNMHPPSRKVAKTELGGLYTAEALSWDRDKPRPRPVWPTMPEELPTPAAEFKAAAEFAGAKEGWVFTARPNGVGYYLDRPPPP